MPRTPHTASPGLLRTPPVLPRAARRGSRRRPQCRPAGRASGRGRPASSGAQVTTARAGALAEPGDRVVRELDRGTDSRRRARPRRARPRVRPRRRRARSTGTEPPEARAADECRLGPRGRAAVAARRGLPGTAPGTRSRRAAARPFRATRTASPSRHAPGIARTSSTSPTQPDHRGRVDRPAVGLVVERHVAGHDRDAERLARLGHALDRLGELPGDLRLLGVPEVEAVRDRKREPAGARDVPCRLEHRQRPTRPRIERGEPALAVQRDREPAVRRPEPKHGRVEPRPAHRARADEVVVAAEDRPAARDVRASRGARGARSPSGRIDACSIGRASSRGARLDPVARRLAPSGAAPGSPRRRRPRGSNGARRSSVTSPIASRTRAPTSGRRPRPARAARARRRRPSAPGSRRS